MKKRFKNILNRTKKKNGFLLLVCVVSLTLTLGTLVGCSITEPDSSEPSPTTNKTENNFTSISPETLPIDIQESGSVGNGGFCSGCDAEMDETQVSVSDEQLQSAENQPAEEVNDTETVIEIEESEAESIQDEIAKVEAKSCEYENADWSSMGQQEMNRLTAEWYWLWDDELNSLWNRLSDELDAETKAKVLDEQRAWIKRKEENVKGAGAAASGGSLQPQLENSTAEEMTRARAYILAEYLAAVRNETFTIPPEIQESIDKADPSLNDVFEKFEGQWIFDEERAACVGIERTETCAYGVEGSNWTVWVTGGDVISDLDVHGYTGNSIIFKTTHDGYDTFYELSFNPANSITFAFGTSLDAMEDVIVCD